MYRRSKDQLFYQFVAAHVPDERLAGFKYPKCLVKIIKLSSWDQCSTLRFWLSILTRLLFPLPLRQKWPPRRDLPALKLFGRLRLGIGVLVATLFLAKPDETKKIELVVCFSHLVWDKFVNWKTSTIKKDHVVWMLPLAYKRVLIAQETCQLLKVYFHCSKRLYLVNWSRLMVFRACRAAQYFRLKASKLPNHRGQSSEWRWVFIWATLHS